MGRIITALLLAGCSTPHIDLGVPGHPDPRLKPQLQFSVDDVSCDGTCTVPRKTLSKISFTPPSKTHLVLLNTCARQIEVWQPENKKFEYSYSPAFGVETKGSCPLLITVVTLHGELHRGLADFDNVGAYNPAKVEVMCNGRWDNRVGAFLCSVASGLPVVVNSATPAVMAGDPESGCPLPTPSGAAREFRIDTIKPTKEKSGLCVYVLLNKAKEEFRLSVNVYSSILGTFPKEGAK